MKNTMIGLAVGGIWTLIVMLAGSGMVTSYVNWDDDAGGDETISVTTTAKQIAPNVGYCSVTINGESASGNFYWGGKDVSTTGGNSLGPSTAVQKAVTLPTQDAWIIGGGTITGIRITLGKC
jgi:hypothetical protein